MMLLKLDNLLELEKLGKAYEGKFIFEETYAFPLS